VPFPTNSHPWHRAGADHACTSGCAVNTKAIETLVHNHIPLLLKHLDLIVVPEVRQAYLFLTHHAATLRGYECRPVQKGAVADFRYEQGGEWPFAFIVNQQSLLWYFRPPGLRHSAANPTSLRQHFADVSENTAGEIKVRISNIEDAQRIAKLVFGERRLHHRSAYAAVT